MSQKQHGIQQAKHLQSTHKVNSNLVKEEDKGKRPLSPLLPTLLQRATQSPQTITPTEAVHLQQTIGNQAVGQLTIQRKMTLGPVGDKYEQEADTVAKQVVGRLSRSPDTSISQRQEEEEEVQMKLLPTISTLQRQEEEEEIQTKRDPMLAGGELKKNVETAVTQAKSGGQSIAKPMRQSMEHAFDTDFSNVKIHTDAQSDHLNRSIQARAFTSGQDIFFRQGEYSPSSSTGQELLAHELTHVVQQNGRQLQPSPSTGAPDIQRLWNPFKKKKKEPSRAFILNPEDSTEFTPKKGDSVYLCDYPYGTPVEVISPSKYDKAGPDDDIDVFMTMSSKRTKGKINGKKYILENTAQPKEVEEAKPEVEKINTESEGSQEDSHKLTIAVARKSPYYFDYQKKRLALRIKNKVNTYLGWVGWPFRKKPKLLGKDEMKNRAARTAVRSRLKSQKKESEGIDDSQVNTEVDKLLTASNIMGHTWVKLNQRQGNTLTKWSFGFWPDERIRNPRKVVPGKVESPDDYHETRSDEERLDLTYPVNAKQYTLALTKAKKRRKEPPSYKMTGYNCTVFAREIALTAGVSFPSQAAVMPFVGKVYNPNLVYEAIEKIKKDTVKGDIPEGDLSKKPQVTLDSNDPEQVSNQPEPEPSGRVVTIDPSKPVRFLDLSQSYELESIEKSTQIEILDPNYPEAMEGWEKVQVKHLETGQLGFIDFEDLYNYVMT